MKFMLHAGGDPVHLWEEVMMVSIVSNRATTARIYGRCFDSRFHVTSALPPGAGPSEKKKSGKKKKDTATALVCLAVSHARANRYLIIVNGFGAPL